MARLHDIELPEGDAEHTLHLNPASAFHPRILLPGDPARAMAIATDQLTEPRMFNHRRGLWGYSGETAAGTGIVIQASGMGGPSAAIVVEELCDLGAELIIRVGTCGAIDPQIGLGDLVVVEQVVGDDGTSRALEPERPLTADPALVEQLSRRAGSGARKVVRGTAATVDLFYDPQAEARHAALRKRGAGVLEMEAATVFAVAARRGVRAACLLGVTDELHPQSERRRLPHQQIEQLGVELGAIATAALERDAAS